MTKRRGKDGTKDPASKRRAREAGREEPTHHPDLEPQHDQPWIPTNQLDDRVRRSPRQ